MKSTVSATLPIKGHEFKIHVFQEGVKEHVVLSLGIELPATANRSIEPVKTRIHSECFTGDVFGSLRCDCGPQLDQALELIMQHKRGLIIYLRQEGRGIGLVEKLKAYNLQDQGHDTAEANLMLGHQADERSYEMAGRILNHFGIFDVELITNNPDKMKALADCGITVSNRIPINICPNPSNKSYLDTKREKFHHMLM